MVRRLVFGAMLLVAFFDVGGVVPRASAPQAAAAEASNPDKTKGEKAGENPADKLNPLHVDFGLAFWTLIVFLISLWILKRYAWGPITQGLQKREDAIAGQISEAQRKNDEARQLLADYEKKLADAQAEVRSLIEQGRRDAEKVGQQVIDKAREEAGVERQRALQQIESATAAALQELARLSASLAVELAGKIVGERLKPSDHNRLIEQAVGAFTQGNKVNGKH